VLTITGSKTSRFCDGFSRRDFLKIDALGGALTLAEIGGLRSGLMGESLIGAVSADTQRPTARARAVIYIFLSGGLSQLDSFDLKPDAPAEIRGEFRPIATRTPGIQICEHLPMLARQSHLWMLVRSLSHTTNGHSEGHAMMLTGRTFRSRRGPRRRRSRTTPKNSVGRRSTIAAR